MGNSRSPHPGTSLPQGRARESLEGSAYRPERRIQGRLNVGEAFIDGSFAPAKKEDRRLAKPNVAKGTKIMAVAESEQVFPELA